jgi:hypothetical protein
MNRTRNGMHIQVALTLFAANFVTWARVWLQDRIIRGQRVVSDFFGQVKHLVRIAANSPALVEPCVTGMYVRFCSTSSLAGLMLALVVEPAIQLELPLFQRGSPPRR